MKNIIVLLSSSHSSSVFTIQGEGEAGIFTLISCSIQPNKEISSLSSPLITASSTSHVSISGGSTNINVSCSSLFLLSLTQSCFEGKKKKREKGNGEWGGVELCGWCASMVSMNGIEGGRIELTDFVNNSNGGIKVEGGEISIIAGKFEENNPKFKNFLSFRRKICCETSMLNIESVKGGDGWIPNSSLFLYSPSCLLEKDGNEIFVPLFIPHLSSIDEPDKTNGMKITFNGDSLFPCSLSFSLFINSSSSSPISFSSSSLSCENEHKCIGEIKESEIEKRNKVYCLLY
jgi:hypothetical protein